MLTRKIARESDLYIKVMDEAVSQLTANSYFNKDEVAIAAGAEAFIDVLRWDYIRGFIDEDHGTELIPLVSRFFIASYLDGPKKGRHRVKTAEERRVNPGKYIAQGNGKKTAGYCLLSMDDGILGLQRLRQKQNQSKGSDDSSDSFALRLASDVPALAPQIYPGLIAGPAA